MDNISADELKEIPDREKNNPALDFINVCTPEEHSDKHIEGVRNVPLDTLPQRIDEFKDKDTVYIHCRSGGRSQVAISMLKQMGVTSNLVNVSGGLIAWEGGGHDTHSHDCDCKEQ
jgi:rhodanese-related sulfurtransferase